MRTEGADKRSLAGLKVVAGIERKLEAHMFEDYMPYLVDYSIDSGISLAVGTVDLVDVVIKEEAVDVLSFAE